MSERLEYFLYRFLFCFRSSATNTSTTGRFAIHKKSIIAATCCLYAVIVLFYHSTRKGKKNSYLRAKSVPQIQWESLDDIKKTDAPRTQWESLNDIKKPVDGEKVEMATRPTPESLITSAEDEVLETANDELLVMEEDVYSAEDSLEERIQKSLDEFLINSKNLSPLKAQEIEAKIVDRVDDKVKSLIAKEEGEIEVIANENLNILDDEALQGKSNDINGASDLPKVNQPKLDSLKESLEKYLKEEIDGSEKKLIQSLGNVTKDVEKEVFKEEGIDVSNNELASLVDQETNNVNKYEPLAVENNFLNEGLGLEKAGEELDSKRVDSVIVEAEDEVLRAANHELSVMEEDIDISKGSLKQGIQKSLDDFLMKDKKLSLSKAMEVEEKILNRVDDKVTSLTESKENELDRVTNDNLDVLDNEALESDQSRLDSLKESLEKYMKEEIDGSEKQIIQSLGDVTKDVETDVFNEEGIDVSDNELNALVEQETKNIKKADISV